MHDQGSLTVAYSLRFTETIKVIVCMVDKNATENFPTVWKHKHCKIRPSRWWDARLLLHAHSLVHWLVDKGVHAGYEQTWPWLQTSWRYSGYDRFS